MYVSDQAVTRGGDGVDNFGANWRHRLFFRIPVRHPDFWNSDEVQTTLTSTLGFLSENEYHFEFIPLTDGPSVQHYMPFAAEGKDAGRIPQEVVLFSGGLGSLGGAIQEAVIDRKYVALVTHKPTKKLERRHRRVCELLAAHGEPTPPLHIPVKINKKKSLNCEYSQRSRSFPYAALAATTAKSFGLSRIRFYENGIVSFNLPPAAQVVGAKATRTTHPRVIEGFQQLMTMVAGHKFEVENPFLWKTKADVVELIANAGCSDTIRYSTRCTRTWAMTKLNPHCGRCSQCIDRRFAILAAQQGDADPGESYHIDLLTGQRDEGEPKTMLASYVETASQITRMTPVEFFSEYGESSRVLRHLDGSPVSSAIKLFELHKKHAAAVTKVVDDGIAAHASDIRLRSLPSSCLIRLTSDTSLSPNSVDSRTASANSRGADLSRNNYIRRKGKCWAVRFDSQEERVYTPDIGFDYLQILVEHAGTPISASKLDCDVRRRTKELQMRTASRADFGDEDAPITDTPGGRRHSRQCRARKPESPPGGG